MHELEAMFTPYRVSAKADGIRSMQALQMKLVTLMGIDFSQRVGLLIKVVSFVSIRYLRLQT